MRARGRSCELPQVRVAQKLPLPGNQGSRGFLLRAEVEFDEVARSELARKRQVGGDHVTDLGISTRCLAIGHQQDGLSRRRHLNRSDTERLGDQLTIVHARERWSLEAVSHPVRLWRNAKAD